jgi:hypothetical protein
MRYPHLRETSAYGAHLYGTVDELRQAVAGFVDRSNTSWRMQRQGHRPQRRPMTRQKRQQQREHVNGQSVQGTGRCSPGLAGERPPLRPALTDPPAGRIGRHDQAGPDPVDQRVPGRRRLPGCPMQRLDHLTRVARGPSWPSRWATLAADSPSPLDSHTASATTLRRRGGRTHIDRASACTSTLCDSTLLDIWTCQSSP